MKSYLLCLLLFNIIIKFCYVKGINVEEKTPEECKIYNNLKNLSNDYNCCNEKCISITACDDQNECESNITVCDEEKEHVQCINLSNMSLNMVPDSLKNFIELKRLYLNNNLLNNLPAFFSNYNNLKILDISNNKFTELPTSITNLPSIKKLYLNNNSIFNLPSSIGNLKTLTNLYISSNEIISIPKEIINLNKLAILDISNNKISNLPEEIGYLFVLEFLNLSNNPITNLPKRISNLAILKILIIDNCPNLNVNFIYFDSPLERCSFDNTHLLCYYPGSCKTIRNEYFPNYTEEIKVSNWMNKKCSDSKIKSAKEEMDKLNFIPIMEKDRDTNPNYTIFTFKNIIITIIVLLLNGLICFKMGEKFKTKNSKDIVIYEKHKVVTPSTETSYINNSDVTMPNNIAADNRVAMLDNVITVNRVEIFNNVTTSQTKKPSTINKNEPIYNAIPVNINNNDDVFLLSPYNKENNKNI